MSQPGHKLVDASKSLTDGLVERSQGFAFECPIHVYKAADKAEGKQRRVAGVISTDNPDRQNEVILQDGLDFGDFLQHGWFNDNHSAGTTDILGYPESVSSYKMGEKMPDGTTASTNCTWVDGYLLSTKKAQDIWELAEALQSTNRRLGYSVEGSIEKRQGTGDRTIARAKIRHVAITSVPVNTDARLEVLARSLSAINKTMSMAVAGSVGPDIATPDQDYTGEGSGRALAREDLDSDVYGPNQPKRKKRAKRVRKSERELSRAEAIAFVKSLGPDVSNRTAAEAVDAALALTRFGLV